MRLAASMVENFVNYLDGVEPEPAVKTKDKKQCMSLKDCFQEVICPTGKRLRTEPDDTSTYESLARTIQELGIGG